MTLREIVTPPNPTLRMKAFRRGQQDMEMCNMIVNHGIGRQYFSQLLIEELGQISSMPQTFNDEATGVDIAELTPAKLEGLRRMIRRMAEQI